MKKIDYWNYRLIKKNGYIGIYEVYYSKDKPHSCTEERLAPMGETLKEIKEDLKSMSKALKLPVLNYEDFK